MSKLKFWPQRLLMLLIGVLVTECGSQLFVALDIGADPFMVLVQGVSRVTGMSYGSSTTIIMLLCLLVILLTDRRHIRPGTVFTMFCTGPIVDMYASLFGRIIPDSRPLPLTLVLVAIGCVVVGIGIGISVSSEAGACTNDLISVIVNEKKPSIQLRWARMGWDAFCIVVGFCMGGTIGIGTVIALTLYGPSLQFFLPVAKTISRVLRLPVQQASKAA